MTERRRSLATLRDDELGEELRSLAAWIVSPATDRAAGSPDPARRARLRLETGVGLGRTRGRWWPFDQIGWPAGGRVRPLRRSLVLALIALVALVAIVGAIGFGVPGIRIIFTGASPTPSVSAGPSGPPGPTANSSPSPSPTVPGPPGSGLDLGIITTAADVPGLAGFPLQLPNSTSVGSPDAIWYRDGRVSLVWTARPGLPETQAPGIGLLVTEFRGKVDEAFFQKMLGPGTTLTAVTVGGEGAWWIGGEPHEFVYLDPTGLMIADTRRVVGDTLIWTRGDLTFRMETALGRAAAIGLAETIH
jgi:hypothetical protein